VWNDLTDEAQVTGFAVAGAADLDLLSDLHEAVNDAIENGLSIGDFQKAFYKIVENNGWVHEGGAAWRARVIFDTNMHSARSFGRFEQQWRVREERRWLRYVTAGDNRVRPDHRVLAGIVRPIDDGFWVFYPPLGFRCRCSAVSYDDGQMKRFGYKETDMKITKDSIVWKGNSNISGGKLGTYEAIDPATGRKKTYREGITQGFQYSPKDYIENLLKVTERPSSL
jgi:SPP1 gp7 family putative phage head morphogenesis protein